MTLAIVLASIGLIAAAYEWVAIYLQERSDRKPLPTITDVVRSLHWPVRLVLAVAAGLAIVDHFVTEVVL